MTAIAFDYPPEIEALRDGIAAFVRREVIGRHERHADILDDPRKCYAPDGRYAPEVIEIIREIRMASAEADQAKAAEVLDAARERANRVVADAEREARQIHERASADVTAHVQDLLASARYDLNQLETRADAARSHLEELRDLAARSLGPDVVRPSSSLGSPDSFLSPQHRPVGAEPSGEPAVGPGIDAARADDPPPVEAP